MNRHVHPTGPACLAVGIALALLTGCSNAASPGPDAMTGHAAVTVASDVDGSTVDAAVAEEAELTVASAIPGLREPRAGLYTAGQPEPEAWKAAARDGISTVINLRPEGEMAGRDEAAEVAAAGLAYYHLPVAGAGDVNGANAEQLRQLIEQAPGPVLVHCASGNRVGALLALGAAKDEGLTTEQAIEFGRNAGMGSVESRVREVLESRPAAE
jgi:uncharacterized protein (TIGR01244 family)